MITADILSAWASHGARVELNIQLNTRRRQIRDLLALNTDAKGAHGEIGQIERILHEIRLIIYEVEKYT